MAFCIFNKLRVVLSFSCTMHVLIDQALVRYAFVNITREQNTVTVQTHLCKGKLMSLMKSRVYPQLRHVKHAW